MKNENAKYLDVTLSIEERVKDLLNQMTLEEKFREIIMTSSGNFHKDGKFSKELADEFFKGMGVGAIEAPRLSPEENAKFTNELQAYLVENTRLGIPALITTECLHGLMSPGATTFPQSITLASSWDAELIKDIAAVIAKEAAACGSNQGLAPDLDLAREPRWGRVEETYGEDPFLCGELGVQYIKGLQGETKNVEKDKIVCTIKHFAAHGSPEGGVNLSPVPVGERQLRELYLPPFERAIKEAGALSVMPAYSEMDGIPCSASEFLMTDILRKEWGFDGYVFSDFGAVDMLQNFHKTAATATEAGIQALKAGMDLEAPFAYGFNEELMEKVRSGEVDIKYVDRAVANVLKVKLLSGILENPYTADGVAEKVVNCVEHKELALKAAQESIVLLKNENNLLPLKKDLKRIAVIGPNADIAEIGDYSVKKESDVSLLQGIKNRVRHETEVLYSEGCKLYGYDESKLAEAVELAKKAEVAIVAVGTTSINQCGVGWGTEQGEICTCGEGFDWTELKLPGIQERLVKEIHETGIPTIVVLLNGRPLTFEYIADKIPAILEAWYPGEEGGNALADILFGDVNPSGKLPITFPKNVGQIPLFYNHKPSARGFYHKPGNKDIPGRDYVFDDTKPLYEFGFGLSYTTFEYSELKVATETIKVGEHVTVSVKVKNTGKRAGKEVVQLYLNDVVSSVTTPVKALKGFKKIELDVNEEKEVFFTLTYKEMALIDRSLKETVEPGAFEVSIGGLKATFSVI